MLGTLDHGQVFDPLHALIEGDAKAMLEAVRHLAEQGPDWNGVLSEILNVFHRVAIAQALPDGVDNGHGDRDRVLALAQALPAEDVQFYYQMGLIGRRDLPLAPDPRGGFEMVLLRMLAFRPADTGNAPSQPLKPVGISQATADSAQAVAGTTPVAPAVAAPAAVVAQPVVPVVEVVAEPVQAPKAPPAPEKDLPWNAPSAPVVEVEAAPESVLMIPLASRLSCRRCRCQRRTAWCRMRQRDRSSDSRADRRAGGCSGVGYGSRRRAAAGRRLYRAGHGFGGLQLPGRAGQ